MLVACLGRLQKVGRARTGAGDVSGARVKAGAAEKKLKLEKKLVQELNLKLEQD